ncbi:unnamed protein product, partial [Heterosigma akashiwo]
MKSAKTYKNYWERFLKWRKDVGQDVARDLAEFLFHLRRDHNFTASTLWTMASAINKRIKFFWHQDLIKDPTVKDLLKSWSDKDLKKKSRSFTRDQLMRFLKDAPNTPEWLQKKAVAIAATYGGLRISELVYLLDTDILEWNKFCIRICIRQSKTDKKGEGYQYIIKRAPEVSDPNPYLIFEQYIEKLEDDMPYSVGTSNQRFWLKYDVKLGKFVNSPVGKNLLAKVPSEIAEFLGLPNPEEFTGHCFRHTFANILANSGCSKVQLQQAGRWKSGAACDGYLANSDLSRTNISAAITTGSFN